MIPDAGCIWRITEKYKVNTIFTSPTAIRLLKKLDFEGNFIKKHNTSSLRILSLAGEKSDLATVNWIHTNFPNVMISDHWG